MIISPVDDAHTDCCTVAMSSHTILDDSNDENEVCACESETEH